MSSNAPFWKYGPTLENSLRKMLNLRYQLIPYIYSSAWQVSKGGSTMMRPLVMDFAMDNKAVEQPYEYMFGKSMLVAPVTDAGVKEREVYLPKSAAWFDWWTGKQYTGVQTIKADALAKIPVFIKAGSIIPVGSAMQYTGQKRADTLEVRICKGATGRFDLYEDEGDNYNYEKGIYSTIRFTCKHP
jgi:alpha-D-xyloside xylohydrolase